MVKNIGQTDRLIRLILGAVLILIGFFVDMAPALGIILMVLGAILIVTAVINFCPIYRLINFNTLKK